MAIVSCVPLIPAEQAFVLSTFGATMFKLEYDARCIQRESHWSCREDARLKGAMITEYTRGAD